jgi:hypothetical protein
MGSNTNPSSGPFEGLAEEVNSRNEIRRHPLAELLG